MKRLLVFILAGMLALQACSIVKEDENTKTYAAYTDANVMQEVALEPEIIISPVLYFLNESQTKLQAETREMSVPEYGLREEYVIRELMKGPATAGLNPVMDGLGLDYLELTPDMVNVYLTREKYMREEDIMNAKLAITSTLAGFTGKKYVNIFINGVQTGYRSMDPTGVFTDLSTDLNEEKLK
jgi:hypothetical protein